MARVLVRLAEAVNSFGRITKAFDWPEISFDDMWAWSLPLTGRSSPGLVDASLDPEIKTGPALPKVSENFRIMLRGARWRGA
jgi:hypothetical protein